MVVVVVVVAAAVVVVVVVVVSLRLSALALSLYTCMRFCKCFVFFIDVCFKAVIMIVVFRSRMFDIVVACLYVLFSVIV